MSDSNGIVALAGTAVMLLITSACCLLYYSNRSSGLAELRVPLLAYVHALVRARLCSQSVRTPRTFITDICIALLSTLCLFCSMPSMEPAPAQAIACSSR